MAKESLAILRLSLRRMTFLRSTSGESREQRRTSRRRLSLSAAVVPVLVLCGGSAAPAGTSRTVVVRPHSLTVGPFQTQASNSFSHLTAAFGSRSTCRDHTVKWPEAAITAYMDSPRGTSCRGGVAVVLALRVGWRTSAGLPVGAPVARMHRLYPSAHRAVGIGVTPGWWNLNVKPVSVLVDGSWLTYGCGAVQPDGIPCGQLLAHIHNGEVDELAVDVGVHVG